MAFQPVFQNRQAEKIKLTPYKSIKNTIAVLKAINIVMGKENGHNGAGRFNG